MFCNGFPEGPQVGGMGEQVGLKQFECGYGQILARNPSEWSAWIELADRLSIENLDDHVGNVIKVCEVRL